MSLLLLFFQNDPHFLKTVSDDSEAIAKVVTVPGKDVLDPIFILSLMITRFLQESQEVYKYQYKFNAKWNVVDASLIQTSTGTAITPCRQSEAKRDRYLQFVSVLQALLQANAVDPEPYITDLIAMQVDSVLAHGSGQTFLKNSGFRFGYLDKTLQVLTHFSPNVSLLNRICAICLLQFENKRSTQLQACYRSKHNELMLLECACEGCVECLTQLNGLEACQEAVERVRLKNVVSSVGVQAYCQLLAQVVGEGRLESLMLQEVVRLLDNTLDSVFIEK